MNYINLFDILSNKEDIDGLYPSSLWFNVRPLFSIRGLTYHVEDRIYVRLSHVALNVALWG